MKLFIQTMIIGAGMLAALGAFASEPTIAPSAAHVANVPYIIVRGDSPTDTVDEQLAACRKKLSATLNNLKSSGYNLIQVNECVMNGSVSGSVAFLR